MTEKGVAFLVLADKQYPQKLAFVFLQEVCEAFFVELQNTYGTSVSIDYTSKIETIESAYAFQKFEKTIHRKRKEFRDVSAKENIDKLKSELMDVNKIMVESFDMLLNRDKNLNKLHQQATDLKMGSADVSVHWTVFTYVSCFIATERG